ncbi:MerR family transcriptional regulator [Rhodospirillaceae bacterium SYSU D60014]|uniref:MerR family transcriptional regulator n=1 Tax=Virgifigura deserti TaxID=2268457 RepID=UPI000E661E78
MNGRAQRLAIGELSGRTGVNIETVRYYEKIGLVPPPARTEGGHRAYEDAHVARLTFIRRARELGFTLDEVRSLLKLVDGGHAYACADVRAVTVEHLDDVRQKIRDLKRLEQTLNGIASRCEGGAVLDCPIVEALFEPAGRG